MKVALCLFGLVGGTIGKDGKGGDVDYTIAYEHYKKHILEKNDVDVFIHSWSVNYEEELKVLYAPKKAIFEKQIRFKVNKKFRDRSNWFEIKKGFLRLFKKDKQKIYAKRAYSRWYSNKKAINLKKEYEIENNFQYDYVMCSRLDLAFFTDVVFSKFDTQYFYASHWNDVPKKENKYKGNRKNHYVGKGFLDLWFFSNSNMMDVFSTLYDNIEKYDISCHLAARQHIGRFTDKIKYVFYRWEDHEIVRRKFYASKE